VGEFVEESRNWTVSGVVPVVTVEMNDATGVDTAAHDGMNNAPRTMRSSPAITGFTRVLWPICQKLRFLYEGVCNTAPSVRPLLPIIIYDPSMRKVKYSP
jgi:hypothetical protein